jgi:hypothetical protein
LSSSPRRRISVKWHLTAEPSWNWVAQAFTLIAVLWVMFGPGSVLILSDFSGVFFDLEAIRVMEETAVSDGAYAKKSAWTGTETFPELFSVKVSSFSPRESPAF